MKHTSIVLIALMSTLLSACAPTQPPCDEVEDCLQCEKCPINPFPEGLVLPQIVIQGRLYWSEAELNNLKANVIEPIIEYYEEQDYTVVSIMINNATSSWSPITSIIVDVIISDNDGNEDPLYYGVLIEKVEGIFPRWEQESLGP